MYLFLHGNCGYLNGVAAMSKIPGVDLQLTFHRIISFGEWNRRSDTILYFAYCQGYKRATGVTLIKRTIRACDYLRNKYYAKKLNTLLNRKVVRRARILRRKKLRKP